MVLRRIRRSRSRSGAVPPSVAVTDDLGGPIEVHVLHRSPSSALVAGVKIGQQLVGIPAAVGQPTPQTRAGLLVPSSRNRRGYEPRTRPGTSRACAPDRLPGDFLRHVIREEAVRHDVRGVSRTRSWTSGQNLAPVGYRGGMIVVDGDAVGGDEEGGHPRSVDLAGPFRN